MSTTEQNPITSLKFGNEEETIIIINGVSFTNYPIQNAYAKWEKEWIKIEGNEIEPFMSFDEKKSDTQTRVNQWRDEAINNAVVSYKIGKKEHLFAADPVSRQNMIGTLTMFNAIPEAFPANFTWRSHENVNVKITLSQLKELGALMFSVVNAAYKKGWEMKDKVKKAKTQKTLDKISW